MITFLFKLLSRLKCIYKGKHSFAGPAGYVGKGRYRITCEHCGKKEYGFMWGDDFFTSNDW